MRETVLKRMDGAVATLTLNRPERLNGMNTELLRACLGALEDIASDNKIRVVVLTGAGKAFCVGGDLAEGAGGDVATGAQGHAVGELRYHMRTSQLLAEMPQVTIAAINGACAGAGLSWACACDLRIAAKNALFNTAFLTAGLSGDFGGTWTLQRVVGPSKARDLYLLPRRFSAEEAASMGLVNEVVESEELPGRTREVTAQLAASAPLALLELKRNLNDAMRLPFSELLDREAERHIRCAFTEDAREAARAFLDKRKPIFAGR